MIRPLHACLTALVLALSVATCSVEAGNVSGKFYKPDGTLYGSATGIQVKVFYNGTEVNSCFGQADSTYSLNLGTGVGQIVAVKYYKPMVSTPFAEMNGLLRHPAVTPANHIIHVVVP
jgi:hypothetical protein